MSGARMTNATEGMHRTSPLTARITRRDVHANGLRFSVHEAGPADAPAVLLLHGFPEMARYWWPTMEALADRFRVVAPDLRGCGDSEAPADGDDYAVDVLVADGVALLDALGLGRVHLVGHDWGGVLAWWVAAGYPRRVERLVVCNAPHPAPFQVRLSTDPEQQQASAYITRLRQPGAAQRLAAGGVDALWSRLRGEGDVGFDAADRAAWLSVWRARGLDGGIGWYRASGFVVAADAPRAWTERLSRLDVAQPTLVVWGAQDRSFVPALAEESAARAAQGRLLRIAEAGHHPPRETPETFVHALRSFIESPGAGR
jgi:pimeloyl-ACP methyl ester carboxylesterase